MRHINYIRLIMYCELDLKNIDNKIKTRHTQLRALIILPTKSFKGLNKCPLDLQLYYDQEGDIHIMIYHIFGRVWKNLTPTTFST